MTRGNARISKVAFRQSQAPANPQAWGAKCSLCPLNGAQPVFGDGPREPVIAIVGEAPGRDESAMGMPFVGSSGETLMRWLSKKGLTRKDVWLDNAVACFPPGGDMKPFLQRARKQAKDEKREFHSPVECCRPRLMRALKVPICKSCGKFMRGPPNFVCTCPSPKQMTWKDGTMAAITVPVGNFALLATRGVEGITDRRGYVEDMVALRAGLIGGVVQHVVDAKGKPK